VVWAGAGEAVSRKPRYVVRMAREASKPLVPLALVLRFHRPRRAKAVELLFAAVVLAAAVASTAGATPGGGLDPSFGSAGKVATDFGGAQESASGLALRSDGKIVVAGFDRRASTWIVARYNTDGSLDTGFGNGGQVETTFAGTTGAGASAVALQPDGKIVAAGWAGPGGFLALARYSPDGSLDSSFGAAGRALIPDDPCPATSLTGQFGGGVAVGADGKLVVAGGRIALRMVEGARRSATSWSMKSLEHGAGERREPEVSERRQETGAERLLVGAERRGLVDLARAGADNATAGCGEPFRRCLLDGDSGRCA
jgi:uncharacterized delta-60 repeat protein